MPLPTTNLTAHFDASDTGKLFTTYDGGGAHSGVPADNGAVQVWDDEGDGIADHALIIVGGGDEPAYRSGTPLMLLPCLDFSGSDRFSFYTQTGGAGKTLGQYISASAFTMLFALYPESITAASATDYENHIVLGDTGAYTGISLKDDSGTTKVRAFNFDGSYDPVEKNLSAGASHVIMWRHESSNLYLGVDGGAEASVASGNTDAAALASGVSIGKGHSSSANYNGRIGEFAIWNAALTGTDLTDAVSYFTAKWLAAPPSTNRRRRVILGAAA